MDTDTAVDCSVVNSRRTKKNAIHFEFTLFMMKYKKNMTIRETMKVHPGGVIVTLSKSKYNEVENR